MIVGDYSKRSITSYVRELRFVAEYFPDVPINSLNEEHITNYMLYLKQSLGCNRDKCRMAASALGFYFKNILRKPYELPSKLYPKKAFRLPVVMSTDEVRRILSRCTRRGTLSILNAQGLIRLHAQFASTAA
jgi:site-specific recombinase XerD